ncbi:MAG: WbqC family protein [Flavobacteriaceae bacterium]
MNILLHPTYFPGIVTFAALVQNNVSWEVWDNYQKQTYRNRCYICTDQGRHMLNIPIKHTAVNQGRQLYRDVKIDKDYPWQRVHWKSLQIAYRSSPFFEFFEEDLLPLFTADFKFLMDFNFSTIETICDCLQIQMPAARTKKYEDTVISMKDARFLVQAKEDHPQRYKKYTQVFQQKHGFVENLSILDLLFNEGNAALAFLEQLKIDL